MTDYLTEAGWQAILQANKGKVTDNGLLKELGKYKHLPEDKYDQRNAVLANVFKLGLALNNSSLKVKPPAAVAAYLSRVNEAAVKMQEQITADKKAAAFDKNDKLMFQNMVIQAATNVSTNAKANASFFGRQVIAACTAFQLYSKSKVDELDGEISAASILGPLISVVSGGIVGALMVGVADPIAKKVVGEMAKLAEGQLKKQAGSIGNGSKDVEKAIKALILGATDAATAMESVVTKHIMPECKKVIDGVNSGNRLNDQLTEFIEPFIRQNPSAMDTLLERRFGLPTPAKSKQTQVKLYKEMVKQFEEVAIKAATPSGEKMEWNITGVPTSVKRKAEERAKQAGSQREKEISAKESQAGV